MGFEEIRLEPNIANRALPWVIKATGENVTIGNQ